MSETGLLPPVIQDAGKPSDTPERYLAKIDSVICHVASLIEQTSQDDPAFKLLLNSRDKAIRLREELLRNFLVYQRRGRRSRLAESFSRFIAVT